MRLVTLTSDFGYEDHYVAMVKTQLWRHSPSVTIVDISHGIEPFNIAHGTYVLKAIYEELPKGSIHILAVHGSQEMDKHIAFQWAGHYFLGSDNGFAWLLTEEHMEHCVQIGTTLPQATTFPARDIYAPAAAKLAQGASLYDLGPSYPTPKKLIAKQPRVSTKQIIGHVIRVDHYGNLISNINKALFEQLFHNRRFEIRFARESIYHIHTHYTQVEPGDCVCVFNSLALLEIAINQGNASMLLGMECDSPMSISFA